MNLKIIRKCLVVLAPSKGMDRLRGGPLENGLPTLTAVVLKQ